VPQGKVGNTFPKKHIDLSTTTATQSGAMPFIPIGKMPEFQTAAAFQRIYIST
jgi:hypothetical protein